MSYATKPEETSQHLVWDCDFALDCWSSITTRQKGFNTIEEMDNMIRNLPVGIAWEIVIMGCWNIWMIRNNLIFKNIASSSHTWRANLRQDLQLILHRIKSKHFDLLQAWIVANLS